jgi:phosphoglycerate kinase
MAGLPAIPSIDDVEVTGRRVLLRVDINSPLDADTRRITSDVRIDRSLPTIRDLSDRGARLVVIAHQGDTLDYHNVASLGQHAVLLEEKLGRPVGFVDDVAGPEARRRILELGDGEILLLDNVRFLSEEMSTFERDVKLTPAQMAQTYLVRNLAPLFDLYVNDAFAAAHRAAPSMIAFQHLLPSAGGRLLEAEVTGLSRIIDDPARPAVFLLGGLKVSDGFSMMGRVLDEGLADRVLTTGVLGEIFLIADGADLGEATTGFIADRDLLRWTDAAAELLNRHRDAVELPTDLAFLSNGGRVEIPVSALPAPSLLLDIGEQTIAAYEAAVARAGTVFVNGPAGAYEQPGADLGTRRLWTALATAPGVTAMGGGDTVASAGRFIDTDAIDFVSTAGGALIRFISGMPLPLFEAFGNTAN